MTTVRAAAPLYTYSQSDLSEKFGIALTSLVQASAATIVKSKAASERSKMSTKDVEVATNSSIPFFFFFFHNIIDNINIIYE